MPAFFKSVGKNLEWLGTSVSFASRERGKPYFLFSDELKFNPLVRLSSSLASVSNVKGSA